MRVTCSCFVSMMVYLKMTSLVGLIGGDVEFGSQISFRETLVESCDPSPDTISHCSDRIK